MTPSETILKQWAVSHWIEYQAWLFHHSYLTLHDWYRLREQAYSWYKKPLISIVTPVYNTPLAYLRECIYSVQIQAYPHWQLCLVDDGSTDLAVVRYLQKVAEQEPRIQLQCLPKNQGICCATNQALAMAEGEYIAFLDHDDRLSPDALYHVVAVIQRFPNIDIIYSDRDMISPEGYRFMHLLKPDWSPETLFSGNYLFHLMVYRRSLIEQLGGLRVGFEGSQDYDLILRAAELQPQVHHLPKILYHWRQHQQSVALEQNAKEYAYLAGLRALREALERHQWIGQVNENSQLWRGNYRVQLAVPSENYQIFQLSSWQECAQQINRLFNQAVEIDYLVVLGPTVQALETDSIAELVAWLQIPAVGMVTGKILDAEGKIIHAGLVLRPDGTPLAIYQGYPESTPGYMAATTIVRNVSIPHPACFVLRRSLWQELRGFDVNYHGPSTLLDFALRALNVGSRMVYTPYSRWIAENLVIDWHEADRQYLVKRWRTWLSQGDPYYHPHLTLELVDMGLELRVKRFEIPHS
ncbi:MAG: hypothetical protein BWK79_13125 [Beggiatoa sp. IS2]|nr:MAG: hypothetical protein BWK79_13125 [Beggiatoa sp. IS2]